MKFKLLNALTAMILFLMPAVLFGQAPNLGTAANFVLFTTSGAVTNSGIPHLTHLTGHVGSNSGSSTGFGNVDGVMHDGDIASGQAAADLLLAYNQLNIAVPTAFPGPLLGNGVTLVPGVYRIPSAATLNLELILDGQGNPNAVFIFQIQGSFSTNSLSKVKLINGAVACNVFWKVEGMVSMASGSTMRGTIVAHNAAIDISTNDTLEGRALSINGAVTTSGILAYTPIGCGSPVLTGPVAPTFVATAAYGILSGVGPVTNTGTTHVGGDVGTNSGLTTGFNPLFVTGTIHPSPDASTAAAASDLTIIYNYLNALPTDIQLLYPAQFGNDLVLTPHTYLMAAAPTFTGNVYLNAEGNPNAVFVIKVSGAFSTSTFSKVILINGAQAKNVYWKITGAVNINDNSIFKGNIIAAGAITSNILDSLGGKVMTTNGAININGSAVNLSAPPCVAAPITGADHVCSGSTTTLSDVDAGGIWTSSSPANATIGSSSGVVTGILPGTTTFTYTSPAACVSTATFTVNAGPAPITGPGNVCIGSTINLSDITPGGTWSSSNNALATVGTGSGIVTGVATGTPMITYAITNGCIATKTVVVGSNAGTITGPSSVCVGSSIMLTDNTPGGIWSASNANATVVGGMVTGVLPGIVSIIYTVNNGCGLTTTSKSITVDTAPNAGIITGPSSVCAGSSITLTDNAPGGVWSASNTNATVVNGVVTGVFPGTDVIRYTVINGCGTAVATKTITVNALPDEGSISGPSNVCVGSSIVLTDPVAGGVWSSSNSTAAVLAGVVTGVATGIDTIRYTVINGCGSATAEHTVFVGTSPTAGIITGDSTVCVGSSIILSDGIAGGVWSSSNTTAMVAGGIVTGLAAGIDTISYTVTNFCGTAVATKTVTVNPLPDAGAISGPSDVCTGSSITLAESVTGGTWSSSNTTATVVAGVVTGVTPGVDTIIYTITNVCGTDTANRTIVVNQTPNAGTITGLSSVCVGSSISLNDTEPGGFYSASNGHAIVFGGNTVIGFSAGIDTITYTVSTPFCSAATTKIITVNPLPDAGVITGPSSVCTGSSIALTDGATGGTWSSSNTHATILGGIVSATTAGIDTISYMVTNVCGSDTTTKAITINATPAIPVISTQPSLTACLGTMYQNFGTATLPDAGTAYNWSATNAKIWAQGTAHQYALVNYHMAGIATITITATATGSGCASGNSVNVIVSSTVNDVPVVSYFNNHFVCTPSNESSYQWGYDDKYSLDSTLLAGEINQDYVNTAPDANKLYWVMTSSGGCIQKTYYTVPTAIQNVNESSLSVYPNPANDVLNVVISSANGKVEVEVTNMMGQKVATVYATDNKATINIASLPAGSYIIACYADGTKIAGARFIKN